MQHFSSADWVDFARGLVSSEKREAIERHLDSGCEDCRKSSSFWRQVAEIGSREADFEPPADLLARMKDRYRVEKPGSRLLEWANLARLVFDSLVTPAPLAVRSSSESGRQLIHESTPFTIDLRLEPDVSRKRIYLTGQIMNAEDEREIAQGVDVVLLHKGEPVSRTEAEPSGEFCMDYRASEDLHLFVNIRGHKGIAVSLPSLET